jgi:type III restriction enzyme
MATGEIDQLIINSPFEEPKLYWDYNFKAKKFDKKDGRRRAGYLVASEHSKSFDDAGHFIEIPLVNKIRPRIKAWRESGYPGATGITRRLLEYWYNPEEREHRRFFFCQLEAIETLIWLVEAPESQRVGIDIPNDGSLFPRICCKMATGSGKTIVMSMLIAWQILNKVTYPQDARFSKNVFVIAPGLTIRSRLQVLIPSSIDNYYQEFSIIPQGLDDKLRQGRVLVRNRHALQWDSDEQVLKRHSVDKRGALSDEAYVRSVMGELGNTSNILVINDEAHHAWRVPAQDVEIGKKKKDIEEATVWIGALDRIHKARTIQTCYDFSATPFIPMGLKSKNEDLFGWIVSDFGLNDAIESGLVKTPRVVVRDDSTVAANFKSRLYHIYTDPEVRENLNRRAAENEPLPDLIIHAYYLLGLDWLEAKKGWEKEGYKTPPVMITVANRVETSARIKYSFDKNKIRIPELCNPDRTLRIDSKLLNEAEEQDDIIVLDNFPTEQEQDDPTEETGPKLNKQQTAEYYRQIVDTVGQLGKPGEQYQNIISVGMLSEGWDAKTVTHILGLRAFTSQLLCEQVVGRGLRRTSYELNDKGFFDPEYVNIFGVPFTFLPHETSQDGPPPPPAPKMQICPDPDKQKFEIHWPNILSIYHMYKPVLSIDIEKVKPLVLRAQDTIKLAELAPLLDGQPDITKIKTIDLQKLADEFRMQKIIFDTAKEVYEQVQQSWSGNKDVLIAQIIPLIEKVIRSRKIRIDPDFYDKEDMRRRIIITLNMNKVVQHIWEAIRFENTQTLLPNYDREHPIRSTSDMRPWYTSKPCEYARKSHINHCVYDSRWETSEAWALDRNENVEAWVKNDHLGFEIAYTYQGIFHKYRPDFIIKLKNGKHLVLEVKGQDTQQDRTKREFLDEWIRAVNSQGGFGKWEWAVSKNTADIVGILDSAMKD